MKSDINITADEWRDWAFYYGQLFPTADKDWIESMVERMMRTLSFCGKTTQMGEFDFKMRCKKTAEAMKAIPRDPLNKLDTGER